MYRQIEEHPFESAKGALAFASTTTPCVGPSVIHALPHDRWFVPTSFRHRPVPSIVSAGRDVPAMHIVDFELSDAAGIPRSLISTLPDGTLRAAQKAIVRAAESKERAGKAEKSKASVGAKSGPADVDALNVYVKARLLPRIAGGSRPWIWAGPVSV